MSNQAITWALETKTPGPPTKVLLIALANYANEHYESYPSIARLADETDQSQASVKRHLNTLVELGLIVRSMRGREDGGRLTNRYQLVVPAKVKAQIERGVTAHSDLGVLAHPDPIASGVSAQVAPGVRAQNRGGLGSTVSPEPKNLKTKDSMSELRPDVERICKHLADRIEDNGSNRPEIGQRWRDAARLLVDKDKRTEKNVHDAIDWSQDSTFWRSNILSMSKLREKYEQLRLAAQHEKAEKAKAEGPRKPVPAERDHFTPPPAPEDIPGRLVVQWNLAWSRANREGRPGPADWRELEAS